MSGIAIVLDLLRKNPNCITNTQSLYSSALISSTFAASAAAVAAGATPFTSYTFFGRGFPRVAHCDFGATNEEYIPTLNSTSGVTFRKDSFVYPVKEYDIELKPLFSAFQVKTFAVTCLRSFLLFYLPLLEPRSNMEEDDDDFLQDNLEERHVDLVVPFKKSLKQIARETTVVTTRRVLERLAVHHVSQRLAWKLLKDVPKSAVRKAQRGMPLHVYIFSVTRTTLRGHFLGVLASWMVTVGLDTYRFFSRIFRSNEEIDRDDREEELQLLGHKIYMATLRCSSSLIFASIGAGIGAKLIRPSTGQWIGCAAGDLIGPIFVTFCFDKLFHEAI
ncbi:hypothetical protein Leryth_016864 [Lithospermum erythrorhizon]|nr:hypothetical protein Leryth_016864 [Lithospermum erythrorhizon]